MEVIPYQWYQVNVELMRSAAKNYLGTQAIITMGCGSTFRERFGVCKPNIPPDSCTFYDCTRTNPGMLLNKRIIMCPGGDFKIDVSYANQVHHRLCRWKKTKASAVAQVSLTPVQGNLPCQFKMYTSLFKTLFF